MNEEDLRTAAVVKTKLFQAPKSKELLPVHSAYLNRQLANAANLDG